MTSGDLVLTRDGNGLNCSNFVLVVFLMEGISLIDFTTWQERPEDADWHSYLVDQLEHYGASSDHVAVVRSEIGCARVRPEEVAGACLEAVLPTTFEQCRANGRRLIQVVDERARGETSIAPISHEEDTDADQTRIRSTVC